jgi:hypothetical protein
MRLQLKDLMHERIDLPYCLRMCEPPVTLNVGHEHQFTPVRALLTPIHQSSSAAAHHFLHTLVRKQPR